MDPCNLGCFSKICEIINLPSTIPDPWPRPSYMNCYFSCGCLNAVSIFNRIQDEMKEDHMKTFFFLIKMPVYCKATLFELCWNISHCSNWVFAIHLQFHSAVKRRIPSESRDPVSADDDFSLSGWSYLYPLIHSTQNNNFWDLVITFIINKSFITIIFDLLNRYDIIHLPVLKIIPWQYFGKSNGPNFLNSLNFVRHMW